MSEAAVSLRVAGLGNITATTAAAEFDVLDEKEADVRQQLLENT